MREDIVVRFFFATHLAKTSRGNSQADMEQQRGIVLRSLLWNSAAVLYY